MPAARVRAEHAVPGGPRLIALAAKGTDVPDPPLGLAGLLGRRREPDRPIRHFQCTVGRGPLQVAPGGGDLGAERLATQEREVRVVSPHPVGLGGTERDPPMVGDPFRLVLGEPLPREPGVKAQPILGAKARVRDIADEPMMEAEPSLRGSEVPQVRQPSEARTDVGGRTVREAGHFADPELLSDDRGRAEEGPVVRRERVQMGTDRRLDGQGQWTGMARGPGQFEQVERIALRALQAIGIVGPDTPRQLVRRVGVEGSEVELDQVRARSESDRTERLGPSGRYHQEPGRSSLGQP